jgi:hypothetical protein
MLSAKNGIARIKLRSVTPRDWPIVTAMNEIGPDSKILRIAVAVRRRFVRE